MNAAYIKHINVNFNYSCNEKFAEWYLFFSWPSAIICQKKNFCVEFLDYSYVISSTVWIDNNFVGNGKIFQFQRYVFSTKTKF